MTAAKRLITVLLAMLALLALPQLARAKTINVGTGTAASCTEFALRSALTFAEGERSSTIQFRCGPAPVTIVLTATLTVPDNTTVNGGGLITLDGQFQSSQGGIGSILRVASRSTVVLKNLNVVRGGGCLPVTTCGSGGGISNEGSLTIQSCTFSGNVAFLDGGAISNQGTLTVRASTFSNNGALGSGGGIFSQGTLAIDSSTFTGNRSQFGAGIFAEGTLTVHDSVFDSNNPSQSLIAQQDLVSSTPLGAPSGAIQLGMGTHTITRSAITRNGGHENGRGIDLLAGTLTVSDSIISQNTAHFGGGIHVHPLGAPPEATLTIRNSIISGNSAVEGVGIDIHGGTVTIKDSAIVQNSGASGGGIAGGGALVIVNSAITGNTATNRGGGIDNLGTLTVRDSTITQNTAGIDGGGIYNGGTLVVRGDTVIVNNAPNDIAP